MSETNSTPTPAPATGGDELQRLREQVAQLQSENETVKHNIQWLNNESLKVEMSLTNEIARLKVCVRDFNDSWLKSEAEVERLRAQVAQLATEADGYINCAEELRMLKAKYGEGA